MASPRYFLLHKPLDVLCQFTDTEGRPTLATCVPHKDVYAVGRLDSDSEGLLLLTDDGALQHRLSHPRFKQPKTYWVQVEGVPDDEALRALVQGVEVQDYVARAARARLLDPPPDVAPRARAIRERRDIPTCWLELVLHEGRNRQVRRMTAAVGHPTLRLLRVALGPLQLGTLAPGACRPLTTQEREQLLVACGFGKDTGDGPPAAPGSPRSRRAGGPAPRPSKEST